MQKDKFGREMSNMLDLIYYSTQAETLDTMVEVFREAKTIQEAVKRLEGYADVARAKYVDAADKIHQYNGNN